VVCVSPTMAGDVTRGQPDSRNVVRSVKGGWLSRNGDFYVLHLKGTWYEMGRAHGELLREQVRENTVDLWNGKAARMLGDGPAKLLRTMILNMRRMLPKEIDEELRGLADGSGVALEELQLATLLGGPFNHAAYQKASANDRDGFGCDALQ
jgi:hypothetical protein